jgi:hypothetical protein
LQVGLDNTSLSGAQLAAIKFDGFPSGAAFTTNNNGEVVPSHAGYIPGDWNKSGALDKNDITTMLSALSDLNAFAAANGYTPGDIRVIVDLDGSGAVTNVDIQKELDLLASAGLGCVGAVPEPASFALMALGGIGLFFARRRRSTRLAN